MRLLRTLPLVAAVGGCATPGPIVRLHPREADVIWNMGRALVERADTGVRVAVAFDHQANDMLALRLEIANETNARIEVGPEDVTYAVCKSEAVASCAPAARVIDPEKMIDTLEVQQSLQSAQAHNNANAGAALVLLSAVSDVGAVGSGHPGRANATANAVDLNAATSARDATVLASIEQHRVEWTDAFRRNSLFPGQAVGGPIYIPIVPDARIVWLQALIAQRKFLFSFNQETRQITYPSEAAPMPTNR
jgi:hypothetical protein